MELQSYQNVPPDEIARHIRGNTALAKMVAEGMGVERFTEAALQLLKQPGIAQCTQESVLGCLLKAAMFNFRLSPELGQCWIVPRKVNVGTKEKPVWTWVATFQIGYKGWIELAFRSGEVESFDFGMVCENDTFDFQQGTGAFLNYRPHSDPMKRGKRTHVWAAAVMRSGRVVFNVVDMVEVERHRKMSDTQTTYDQATRQKSVSQNPVGIWAAHYDQMAKRIPTKYLCSLQLPKSELILRAIEADGSVTEVTADGVIETPQTLLPDNGEQRAALLEKVADGLQLITDAKGLKAYFDQSPEWGNDREIIGLFTARKLELQTAAQ